MLTHVDNWSFLPDLHTWLQPDCYAGVTFSESYDSGSGSIPSEDMILFFSLAISALGRLSLYYPREMFSIHDTASFTPTTFTITGTCSEFIVRGLVSPQHWEINLGNVSICREQLFVVNIYLIRTHAEHILVLAISHTTGAQDTTLI